MWSSLKNHSDVALLFVRIWFGVLVAWVYGWPKLAGGLRAWEGYARQTLDASWVPGFWGFLAAFGETIGCALLVLGLFARPVCLLLGVFFAWAALATFLGGGLDRATGRIVLTLFCFTLLFVGPGRFSLDKG